MVLVEDTAVNAKIAIAILAKKLGQRVTHAVDGVEALECLERQRFDLVLMDVQMPRMDGLEATRRWRLLERQRGLARTRIAALTGMGSAVETMEAGMDEHMDKPFKLQQLVEALDRARAAKAATAAAAAAP